MSDRIIELAEELKVIIENLAPIHMQDLLLEISNAVYGGYGNEELTEEWWEDADWFDIAMYCVMFGAMFDNSEIDTFLYEHKETRSIRRKTDMYGVECERRAS